MAGAGQSDPVMNVSPEMNAASRLYGQKIEDIFVAGMNLWKKMKQMPEENRKIFFIGTNGNGGDEISESFFDALAYIQAPDGTYMIQRKPDMKYPKMYYWLMNTEKMIANKSRISPVDLWMEDEDKYRDLETEAIREFVDFPSADWPIGCILGEGAVVREENREMMKKGLVIWLDVDPHYSWVRTQAKPMAGQALYVTQDTLERPPVWAIANGWDGDVDDSEGKAEYEKVLATRKPLYEGLAALRLRTDIPGIAENSYWGAERLIRLINEHYGFSAGGDTVEAEVMSKDLAKFLEGARLTKYLEPAIVWCEEQGAASIEDVAENIEAFAAALDLKPLEKKRLDKAAAAVVM